MKKETKRRWAMLVIASGVMALLFTAAACGAGNTQTPAQGETSAQTEAPEQTVTPEQTDTPELAVCLPILSGIPIKDALELADAFINALNAGIDLTGEENAMDGWREMFDFEQTAVFFNGIYEVEYSENLYQFEVGGKAHNGDVVAVAVYVNLQGEEPWFFCPYIRYRPYALPVAEHYLALLAERDVKRLAVWLSVDGGSEPSDDLIRQGELALAKYGLYDLSSATVTGIRYDNEAHQFVCTVGDASGASFKIALIYGDGLIMPARLDQE